MASHNLHPTAPDSISVTATEAKKEFGRILEEAIKGHVVTITKHDAAKAVLISVEQFKTFTGSPQQKINTLSAEFDAMLDRMQRPRAREAMQAAFDSSPEQLGKAAVRAARKRG